MNSDTDTNAQNPTPDDKSEGFNFAVTSITALVAFLSGIYLYIQNIAVEEVLYGYASLIIPIVIISIILFMIYIIIHGILIKIKDLDTSKWETLASVIYLSAFSIFSIILLLILSFIFIVKNLAYINIVIGISFDILALLLIISFKEHFLKKKSTLILTIILLLIVLILFLIVFNPVFIAYYIIILDIILGASVLYKYIIPKQYSKWVAIITVSLILISVTAWNFLVPTVSYFTKGNIIIDMGSIYYKNGTPIPVSIQITGIHTNSTIYLYNETLNNLTEIDNISLEPKRSSDKIVLGKNGVLFGNAYDSGKYDIFINTTSPNITEGYYELVYSRIKDESKYGKSFYLLNAGEK